MIPATFFAIASLFAGVLANPVAKADPSPVEAAGYLAPSADAAVNATEGFGLIDARGEVVKRVEGVHLLNCGSAYSVVLYCPNDSSCSHTPNNACTYGNIITWEGGYKSCTFPTGVTFWWNIVSNAQSYANFAVVGNGGNGYTNFVIRKDDKHTFYTDGYGTACKTIYYSLPN
ncbi:hypothetical protein QBC38DRAFT_485810 [Podospora fimiseda]|uniref:Secreted protein n=1 Tax=Podospora fimiseda TaxID=252190 RepID=A0AAN7BJ86_9PEZI|nr:hypothetical protein QBC38DRAFT_485810 [Podospora fimiseda]